MSKAAEKAAFDFWGYCWLSRGKTLRL